MISPEQDNELMRASSEGHLIPSTSASAQPSEAGAAPRRMGIGQRAVVALLLTVVLVPPSLAIYSYFSGVPLHLLASKKDDERRTQPATKTKANSIPSRR